MSADILDPETCSECLGPMLIPYDDGDGNLMCEKCAVISFRNHPGWALYLGIRLRDDNKCLS